jgi:putative transposase
MEECKILGIRQIFTSYNNPKGNANTERYLRMYKEEVVWPVEEMSYSELVARTKEYEKFYNRKYPHSALKYKSPREVYELGKEIACFNPFDAEDISSKILFA